MEACSIRSESCFATPPLMGEDPIVVWGGTSWIVLWTSTTVTAAPGGVNYYTYNIMATHLDREGHLLDNPVAVGLGFLCCDLNAIATNGSRLLIGYGSHIGSNQAGAILVDATTLRQIADVPIGTYSYDRTAFVPYGDGFVIFSQKRVPGDTVFAQEIDGSGHRGRSALFASLLVMTAAATDGTDFLLVGFSGTSVTRTTRAASVKLDGSLSGLIENRAEFADAYLPGRALWTGDHYVTLRMKKNDLASTLLISRMDRDGRFVDEINTGHALYDCCVFPFSADWATNGTSFLLASAGTTLNGQIFSTSFASRSIEKFALTMSAAPQARPAIASSEHGTEMLVWREGGSAFATRLGTDGSSLDGTGVHVLPEVDSGDFNPENLGSRDKPPAAVFDGTEFIIPYIDMSGRVRTRFVSIDRGVLPLELTLAEGLVAGSRPAAARGRNSTLVAWSNQERIVGATIDGITRGVVMPPVELTPATAADRRVDDPVVAWNGSQYLLIWSEKPTVLRQFGNVTVLRAMRVTGDLLPIDTEPLTIGTSSETPPATVASDGKDWLVVWSGAARRLLADGSMSPPASAPESGAVVWTGKRYAVVWYENGTVKLAEVAPTGPIAFRTPTVIASATYDNYVGLAKVNPDRIAVGYTRFVNEEHYGNVPRVFARYVTFSTEPRRQSVRH